jgi:nucleoside-diphosphate-sugar epimerase
MKKNKPTILITGSEGSLASWVIKKVTTDYNIIGVDNCVRHGPQHKERTYTFLQGDLCDQLWVDSIFKEHKPDYVLHCAAQIYGVAGLNRQGADILTNNINSTISILSASAKYKIQKIAYISSSMVYERASSFPLVEDMVDNLPLPNTGYGTSKLVGERLVIEYHKQYGLDYVIWRPFNIVTPLEQFEHEHGIAHVLTDFIKKIVLDQCESVEIFGSGDQIRCFTWINDVADTIVESSWLSCTKNQIYNLGSEVPTKIIDLAKLIWQKSGRSDQFRWHSIPNHKDDVITRIPDCNRAKTIGWHHTKMLEELVDICLATARRNNGSVL